MSILEILLAVVALLMTVFGIIGIVKQRRNKAWEHKKKNYFGKLGETGDPVHFSKRKK